MVAIGALATVFLIVFRQTPKEHTVVVHNAAEAEKALSAGERLTIGLKLPEPFVIVVRDRNGEELTTSDGRTLAYRDISLIRKGNPPFNNGSYWNAGYKPVSDVEKFVTPGETVTIWLKGPKPFVTTITHKGKDDFSTEDGQIITYGKVSYVTSDTGLLERIVRTLIAMPLYLLWACVDLLFAIAGHFGFH